MDKPRVVHRFAIGSYPGGVLRRTLSGMENELCLREPVDLLAAVPYLLGFHPTDSLVIVGLSWRRVGFTLRVDLPRDRSVWPAAKYLGRFARRAEAQEVILVGYGPAKEVTPMVDAVEATLNQLRIPLWDVFRVADGRYWSYTCDNPACCALSGTPYEAAGTVVAAQATFAGRIAHPDRTALEHALAPVAGRRRAAVRRAVARVEAVVEQRTVAAGLRAVREGLTAYQGGARALGDEQLARLQVLSALPPVRDDACDLIDKGPLEPHMALWTDVLRNAVPPYAAPVATLLAYTAWRYGDGVVAGIAVRHALRDAPEDPLAMLVGQLVASGVPPAEWERVRTGRHSTKRWRCPPLDGEVP